MRYEDWGAEEFGLTRRGRLVGPGRGNGYEYGYDECRNAEAVAVGYARGCGGEVTTAPFPDYDSEHEYVEDTLLGWTGDDIPLVGSGKTKRRASEMSVASSCPGRASDVRAERERQDSYGGRKRQDRGTTPTWDDLLAFADQRTRGSVRSVTDDLGGLWMDPRAGDMLFAGMLLSVG
jgi:hypothetical protein